MQLSLDAADRLVELVEERRGPVVAEEAARRLFALHPAGICIGGLHPNPVVPLLEHPQRLAAQRLGDLLGVVRGLGPQRRELACERMFA